MKWNGYSLAVIRGNTSTRKAWRKVALPKNQRDWSNINVVDRDARDKAAAILRHFISGQITNFKFEGELPSSNDPVISAIEDSMWFFYDDLTKHKMKGDWALPKQTKEIMARWIMFLYTDEEYKWPEFPHAGVRPLKHGWLSRLLGKAREEQMFMGSGAYNVWPFFNKESYKNAKRDPKLLSGPL
jgi:hypothetical protein